MKFTSQELEEMRAQRLSILAELAEVTPEVLEELEYLKCPRDSWELLSLTNPDAHDFGMEDADYRETMGKTVEDISNVLNSGSLRELGDAIWDAWVEAKGNHSV